MKREIRYKTRFVKPEDDEGLRDAAKALAGGEVVAFPTETVYGLGADALSGQAVKKIFEAKGRPSDNPLIVHIYDKTQIDALVSSRTPVAEALINAFMPGPVTIIMKKASCVPSEVTAGLDTVGIRMPEHPVANEFLRLCGRPVAAPSANLSGSPSPTTAHHVLNDMDGYIYAVIDGGPSRVGLESTVIDATGEIPVILRPGAITAEMIDSVINKRPEYAGAVGASDIPPAPGMKYRHYAPSCKVEIISVPGTGLTAGSFSDEMSDSDRQALFDITSPFILRAQEIIRDNPAARIGIFAGEEVKDVLSLLDDKILSSHLVIYPYGSTCDIRAASHSLFSGLRHLDLQDVDIILAAGFKGDGLEVAYMNRLSKAAVKGGGDVPSSDFEAQHGSSSELPLDYFDDTFTSSVLFVTEEDTDLGAICEGVFTMLLRSKGPFCSSENMKIGAELYAESAGLGAAPGRSPSENVASAFMEITGGTISHHVSSRVEVSVLDGNDLILTVSDACAFELLRAYPELEGRVFSFSSYMASKGLVMKSEDGRVASVSIPEPEGEDRAVYEHTVSAVKAWLEILFPFILSDLGAERI